MHEVLKSGGIDITERSLRTFRWCGQGTCIAGKEGCRWPPGASAVYGDSAKRQADRRRCRKKAASERSVLSRTTGRMAGPALGSREILRALSTTRFLGSGVRRTAVRRGIVGFPRRDADANEVAMGDGRALAWSIRKASPRAAPAAVEPSAPWRSVRRSPRAKRRADRRRCIVRRTIAEPQRASVAHQAEQLARLAVARSAPPWTSSLANRQKKGPVPIPPSHATVAGTGPEGYRYAAARSTGIPILRALSTRLLVMPEPGKARRPFGRKLSKTSLRRKGAALPSRSQFGLQTT